MHLWERIQGSATALTLAGALAMSPLVAGAVDINAGDFTPAPPGTNAGLLYTTYATRDSYVLKSGDKVPDSSLDSLIGIFRYVHYMDVGGFTVAPEILLPFGTLYDGQVGGTPLSSASGFADPIVALPVWIVNRPDAGTYVTLVPYLYLPLGSYDAGEVLNLGENRLKFDLQLGVSQKLTDSLTLEAGADVLWYGDNDDATARGQGKLEQDNTYQGQLWLTYAPLAAPGWSFSAGYSKLWGGDQTLDGVDTGTATRSDQIRLQAAKFIAPDFQVLVAAQRDLNVEGGFEQDFSFTLRLMKLF